MCRPPVSERLKCNINVKNVKHLLESLGKYMLGIITRKEPSEHVVTELHMKITKID